MLVRVIVIVSEFPLPQSRFDVRVLCLLSDILALDVIWVWVASHCHWLVVVFVEVKEVQGALLVLGDMGVIVGEGSVGVQRLRVVIVGLDWRRGLVVLDLRERVVYLRRRRVQS